MTCGLKFWVRSPEPGADKDHKATTLAQEAAVGARSGHWEILVLVFRRTVEQAVSEPRDIAYPLVICCIAMEHHHAKKNGKATISMGDVP